MEVLIVIAIFAVIAVGVSFGIGALHRTKLRSGAVDIVGASRFAYHRAVSRAQTVRIVLDLDAHTLSIEEAHGHVTLDVSDDADIDPSEDRAGSDPWARAEARLSGSLSAQLGRSAFSPIAGSDGRPMKRYMPRRLPVSGSSPLTAESAAALAASGTQPNVRILRLTTPHEREPREQGRGYIYFFPGGRAEHAFVLLSDSNAEHFYTVEIHPLTGRAIVHPGIVDPPQVLDADEVRDNG